MRVLRPSESVIFQGIEGWLTLEEADSLYTAASHVPQYGCIVEIGSFKGRSTYALALACLDHDVKIYAVDPFTGSPKESQFFPAGFGEVFAKNLAGFIQSGVVVPLVMTSGGALMRDLHPDLVFVDGSHIFEDALFDMTYWWERLPPGGRMAIHDATGTHPPVRDALTSFLASNILHVDYVTGSIAWLTKPKDSNAIGV